MYIPMNLLKLTIHENLSRRLHARAQFKRMSHFLFSVGCDAVVQSPWNPVGESEILHPGRYLECGVYIRRNDDKTTIVPWRLRNWSAV